MTDATTTATLARVAAVPAAPQNVAREIPASRLGDFFDMARIGMGAILVYRIEGQPPVAMQLACSPRRQAGASLDEFAATVSAQWLSPLSAAGRPGYLLQARTSTAVYVPDSAGDLLVLCTKDVPLAEECHCG